VASANTVVVIGGAGFIGSHVARELITSGTRVRILAGPPKESRSIDFAADACIHSDIADSKQLFSLLAGAETVVHAAGPASVTESFDREAEYMRVHVAGTGVVLHACQSAGIKRIVYISSAEVYGNAGEGFVSESRPPIALSPYGAAKIGGEQLVCSAAFRGLIEAVVLRLFCVYGPGMSQSGVVGQILAQVTRGDCITIRDARPVRDFCYVNDVAGAIVRACTIPIDQLAIINVGTGKGTSIGELAALAAKVGGAPGVQEAGEKRPSSSEIFCSVADTRAAKELLDWQASTSLREGLAQTLESMKN
jgi:UDP-glucose 4-epimerase